MTTPTLRILVVDDYEPFRRFVLLTLKQKPDLQVVGEAADGVEAVEKAEVLLPDLIVLDLACDGSVHKCHKDSLRQRMQCRWPPSF